MIDIERVKIAGKIRDAIREKGISLADLAKAHDITAPALQHVINGHRGKTAESALTIALGEDPWVKWCGVGSETSNEPGAA